MQTEIPQRLSVAGISQDYPPRNPALLRNASQISTASPCTWRFLAFFASVAIIFCVDDRPRRPDLLLP